MRLDPSKKYIHQFDTYDEYNSYVIGSAYTEPFVATHVPMDESVSEISVKYNSDADRQKELMEQPLTFEILSSGNIVWKSVQSANTLVATIEYSKNGGAWTSITSATGDGATISVTTGDVVQFRGDNDQYSTGPYDNNFFSGTTCNFNVKGNIMSLINSTGFSIATTLEKDYALAKLFYRCTKLKDASNLKLPATTLSSRAYYYTFYYCTGMTSTPELPAMTLSTYCYQSMFSNCKSLTKPPKLPATTLANGCYYEMFYACSGLIEPPKLPATTLANGCYYEMFRACTSLTSTPELPAKTLVYRCYRVMFYGCTNLVNIRCLATNISATECTVNWTKGVSELGTFTKDPLMSEWTTGFDGIPENWTVQNA